MGSNMKMKDEHLEREKLYDKEQDMNDEPCHGESFTGSIGGHSHPNKTHSTWGDHLSPDHSSPTEMPKI